MKILSAEFICSNTDYKKCPLPNLAEFAFIGRSNVGKSSLINMLMNRKGLAKTSSTPGKTQTINHFIINGSIYIVDLPGYGFAKTSKVNKEGWQKMIDSYLLYRKNLVSVFVLIDSRLEPQKNDLIFLNNLGENEIPFTIIFTKADKQTKTRAQKNVEIFCSKLSETWQRLPECFISSAETGLGRDEILAYIEETSGFFKK